jgi:BirA family transcriptional regulator, biotin operon repressor / biotin---[acetyl-CoA-carboxylase] ligase
LYKIQPKTVFVGKTIKYLPTCHSTNEWCANFLENENVSEGFSLYTSHQTHGKGQRGNSWEAEKDKNITMSIVLKPEFLKASSQFQLNIAISLGVYVAISKFLNGFALKKTSFYNENLKIKWPNDIYFSNKKIGGILIENTILGTNLSTSIIGIGLNINQLTYENEKANSLREILGTNYDLQIEDLMTLIFEEIEAYYLKLKAGEIEFLNQEYLKALFRINQWHNFRKNGIDFSGKINGIDNFGRLKIETQFGLEVFDFKEVEFVI